MLSWSSELESCKHHDTKVARKIEVHLPRGNPVTYPLQQKCYSFGHTWQPVSQHDQFSPHVCVKCMARVASLEKARTDLADGQLGLLCISPVPLFNIEPRRQLAMLEYPAKTSGKNTKETSIYMYVQIMQQ